MRKDLILGTHVKACGSAVAPACAVQYEQFEMPQRATARVLEPLRVNVVGPLELRRRSRVLPLPRSKKTRALLAFPQGG